MQKPSWLRDRTIKAVYFRIVVCSAVLLPTFTTAQDTPADLCFRAAQEISTETDVPIEVLLALGEAAHGQNSHTHLARWPWTVTLQGRSIWFDTENQSQNFIFRHFKSGLRRFDVGCFQVSYRWHGHAFQSIEALFDPKASGRYAAGIIVKLHQKYGDWKEAIAAYRARTTPFARRHAERFAAIDGGLPDIMLIKQEAAPAQPEMPIPPLEKGGVGSLVPLAASVGTSLFHTVSGAEF